MNPSPTTLVMGARSGIGRLVLRELVGRDVPVRASARRTDGAAAVEGVPLVAADLTDPASLAAAFDGVARVFLFAVADGAPAVLEAARAAGVERVVLLSSGSVLLPGSARNLITVEHRRAEEGLTSATGPVLVPVRPLVLATNALGWAPQITAAGRVGLYQPDALNAPVHEADVAAVAAVALTREPGTRTADDPVSGLLTGPARLSQREQVAALARAAGRAITVVEQGRDEALERMGRVMPADRAEAVLTFLDDCAAGASPATGTARTVLGRDPLGFARWAADHADAFR